MVCSAKPWKSITFLSQVFRPVINIDIFIIVVVVVVVTRRTLQASVGLFLT